MAKGETYRRLIHSSRWLQLRRRKLSEEPLCERCAAMGRIAAATEVHHVRPVEDGLGDRAQELLMFDYHNLQSLCHRCHALAHKELGSKGKEGQRRRTERQKEDFRRRFLAAGGEDDEGGSDF